MHYTVTITDTGQTPYNGATDTDELDGVLATPPTTATPSPPPAPSPCRPDLTWTGDLAVGASATVTYSVTVNDPDTGRQDPDQYRQVGQSRH